MTWYMYQNYGTALQAVALNKAISNLGYRAFDIAYDPELNNSRRKRKLIPRLVNRVKGFTPLVSAKRSLAFNIFLETHLPRTSPINTDSDFRDLNGRFDAFVSGSDQIWSPRCFDARYFLDFVDSPKKKISYGPSFGCDVVTDPSIVRDMSRLISDYSSLSVREKSGIDIVESLTGRRPVSVVDPTLLLNSSQWANMMMPHAEPSSSYCLFYFLGSDACNELAARKIAADRDLNICVVPIFERQKRSRESVGTNVGPGEFLALIQGASLVLTDSFHGMVFAALLNREFVAFERFDPRSLDSQNTRIYSFLDMIDSREALLSRRELETDTAFTPKDLDFDRINKQIEQRRQESLDYLRGALSRATDGGI